jgi:hypothetical protein
MTLSIARFRTQHPQSPVGIEIVSWWIKLTTLPMTGFGEEIEVMKSLQKPRKITLHGDDGNHYVFLGKPKDDLRKDARLMDFNAIINKLLKKNSESRKRQLRTQFELA